MSIIAVVSANARLRAYSALMMEAFPLSERSFRYHESRHGLMNNRLRRGIDRKCPECSLRSVRYLHIMRAFDSAEVKPN